MRDDPAPRAPNSGEARAAAHAFYGVTDLPSVHDRSTLVVTHGEGLYVVDTNGRRYLDGKSGLRNEVAGFDHSGLTTADKAQYDRFPAYHAFFGRMWDQTVMLSERLSDLSPWDSAKVSYANSGSEANDTMVKMLWLLTASEGRPHARRIPTRINGYHGVTVAAASMTGKPYNALVGLPLPGFVHLTCPHFWREGRSGESAAAFTARLAAKLQDVIAREGADTIAGFFAEPVQGVGAVIPLIADEVICGFGRTGAVWGCQTYDFVPDAIIASEALTLGNFPMGAVIMGPELSDRLQRAVDAVEEVPHGVTARGHPVGCAIALKAIDVALEEGLLDRGRAGAPRMRAGLAQIAEHPNLGELRGIGYMRALEAVRDGATRTPFEGHLSVSARIANTCTDPGLICRTLGQSVVLSPPFILTDGQMDEMCETLDTALRQIFDEVA